MRSVRPSLLASVGYAPIATTALAITLLSVATVPCELIAQHSTSADFRVDATITDPVLAIALGPDGRVWLGTETDLLRYDGYIVDRFTHDPSDSTSLPFGPIRTLLGDSRGRLWVGMAGGLVQFDPIALEVVRVFRHDPSDPSSLSADDVSALHEDREGRIWVGTLDWGLPNAGGLNRFDEATGSFERFMHDPTDPQSLSHNRIRSILQDDWGDLWVGTWGGLNRLRPGEDAFQRYLHDERDATSLAYDDVMALHEDTDGNLWVATIGSGLDRFDRETGRFVHLSSDPEGRTGQANPFLTALEGDSHGRLWIGTLDAGLQVLERTSGEIRRVNLGPDLGTDTRVFRLFRTPDNVLWVSVADRLGSAGTLLRFDLEMPALEGRAFGSVIDLYEDAAGTVWMGTFDGELLSWDRESDSLRRYVCPGSGAPSAEQWLSSVTQSPDGTLWLGFWDGELGLCRLDPGSDAPRVVRLIPNSEEGPTRSGALPDIRWIQDLAWWDGRLWLAYNAGLASFDPESGEVRDLHMVSTESGPFEIGAVNQLELDPAGYLWVAIMDRWILRFDPHSDRITLFDPIPSMKLGEASGGIRTITPGRAGTLWIGTLGRGVWEMDSASGSCTQVVGAADALPEASVVSVLEDARGHLWIGTRFAITGVDPETGAVRNLPLPRRLRGMRLHRAAALAAPSGELFFTGSRGVLAFRPEQARGNLHPPKILITDVQTLGSAAEEKHGLPAKQDGHDHDFAGAGPLVLSHRQNDLTFQYAALHFADPARNRYRVRLEGYETEWHDVGSLRRVRYASLAPGSYIFRVRAASANGVWSDEDARFAFRILAPWWRRPWAIALWSVIALAGLAGIRSAELRKVRAQAALENERAEARRVRELAEARSRLFANLSHEYRTPLSLILGQIESARAERDGAADDKLRMAERQARELERLTDEILELSRLEAGGLELNGKVEDLAALARNCAAAFDSRAERQGIRFILDLPKRPVMAWIDRDRMARVVNNLLSNALKFTDEGGAVSLTVREVRDPDKERVVLAVEDTGIGIPASALPEVFDRFYQVDAKPTGRAGGTGIGLALVRELVQLHGGEVTVQSEIGVGTRFEVRLPPPSSDTVEVASHREEVEAPRRGAIRREPSLADPPHQLSDPEGLASLSDEATEADGVSEGPPIVLVVEDHPDMRAFLKQELAAEHRVEEAADGAAGFARAVELVPDLLITDLMMPELDGYELVRRLRADERTSHVPIIMLTARASEDAEIEGLETGVDAYLAKPFSARVLRTRVRNLLNLRRLLRSRYADEIWLRPEEIEATPVDRRFLDKVTAAIESGLSDPSLSVESLASAVAMSRSQLHRKLIAILDQSPGALIRGMRLRRAADLLRAGNRTISQIAYETGFSDQAHFTRSFKQQFGCTPSEYRDQPTESPAASSTGD